MACALRMLTGFSEPGLGQAAIEAVDAGGLELVDPDRAESRRDVMADRRPIPDERGWCTAEPFDVLHPSLKERGHRVSLGVMVKALVDLCRESGGRPAKLRPRFLGTLARRIRTGRWPGRARVRPGFAIGFHRGDGRRRSRFPRVVCEEIIMVKPNFEISGSDQKVPLTCGGSGI
jgi:hypothetical protein